MYGPPQTATRQSRKRRATRQRISDIATGLFFAHGFDNVTIDRIAEAADVARMTVFNHFPRKEDIFFDLDDSAREQFVAALRSRPANVPPIEALRRFTHHAVATLDPYTRLFEPGTERFMAVVQASGALRGRAREIRDEWSDLLTAELARAVGHTLPDPTAHLAASLLLAGWAVALSEAQDAFHRHGDPHEAKRLLLSIADQAATAASGVLHLTAR